MKQCPKSGCLLASGHEGMCCAIWTAPEGAVPATGLPPGDIHSVLARQRRRRDLHAVAMAAVTNERVAQDLKWGTVDQRAIGDKLGLHLLPRMMITALSASDDPKLMEERARKILEDTHAVDPEAVTWAHIFNEELFEAIAAGDKGNLREELVQCAALIVFAIESLDHLDE